MRPAYLTFRLSRESLTPISGSQDGRDHRPTRLVPACATGAGAVVATDTLIRERIGGRSTIRKSFAVRSKTGSLPRGAAPGDPSPSGSAVARMPLGGQLSGCRPPGGNLFQFDGWVTLGRSRSGTDSVRTPGEEGHLGLMRRSQIRRSRATVGDDADGAKERTDYLQRRGWRRGCSLPDRRSCQCRREYLHYWQELSTWRPHANQCQ